MTTPCTTAVPDRALESTARPCTPAPPTGWADVTNPATGRVTGRVALASEADAAARHRRRRRGRAGAGARPRSRGVRRCCSPSASCSTPARTSSPRSSPPSTARCTPTRSARSPAARRSWSSRAASRTCSRAATRESVSTGVDVHSKRDPLGVVGIICPFNFPAMVPMWFFPIAIAAGNTVVLKPSEKDPSAAMLDRRGSGRRPGSPTASSTCSRATRRPSTRCCTSPDVAGDQLRRLHADRGVRLRAGLAGTASASRPSAAPRTTWSSCPTPTSTWPPTRPSTPATAARASAAWRSACSSRSARSATSSSPGSPTAPAPCVIGDGSADATGGARRRPTWARSSRRPTATRSPSFIDSGAARRREGRRRRPRGRRPRRRRTASGSARRCSTTSPPDMDDLPRGDLRPGAVGGPRRHLRRGGRAGQRQPVRQRHRGLHQRRRGGPPLRGRRPRRHDRRQRAGPGAGRLLLLRRLEAVAASATPTPTAPRASTSSPAARSSPPGGSTPPTAPRAASSWDSRAMTEPDHERPGQHVRRPTAPTSSTARTSSTPGPPRPSSTRWSSPAPRARTCGTATGSALLDFTSQLVFTNLGHQHPRIVAAIQEQAAHLCTVAPAARQRRRGPRPPG